MVVKLIYFKIYLKYLMYNNQVVFYLLTLFVIFGGGILDTKYINISNICLNLALLAPLFILKAKVEGL